MKPPQKMQVKKGDHLVFTRKTDPENIAVHLCLSKDTKNRKIKTRKIFHSNANSGKHMLTFYFDWYGKIRHSSGWKLKIIKS